MAVRGPESILKQLDKILAETVWKGPPSDLSHLADPDHLENFKKLGNHEQTISKWIVKKAGQLIKAKSMSVLQVCSIGCADGIFDALFLEEISRNHPSVSIHYVGINADEQVCEAAEEQMGTIGENVTVELVTEDYHELKKENFSPFDLILMVNPQFSCIYDESEVEPLMGTVLELLKPKGELAIVSSSRQSFTELIARFWQHQRRHDLYTTEFLTRALQKMGVTCAMEQEPLTFDLSRCINEEFKSMYAMLILDHLMLVKLGDYNPEVAQLCVEYLASIAEGNGLVGSLCDMVVVST